MDYVQNNISDYHSFQTPPGLWGLAEEQIKQLQANFSLPKLYKQYIRTIWIHTFCFQLELKFKTVYCHHSLNTDRYFCEPLDKILGHCSAWYVTGDVCLQGARVGVQNPKGHGCMVPPQCLHVPSTQSHLMWQCWDSDWLKFPPFGGNAQPWCPNAYMHFFAHLYLVPVSLRKISWNSGQ